MISSYIPLWTSRGWKTELRLKYKISTKQEICCISLILMQECVGCVKVLKTIKER